jgi:hypothetical protein
MPALQQYMPHDDSHPQALRVLESNSQLNQRDLVAGLSVRLKKTDYCLSTLVDNGFIKIQSFPKSQNKSPYAYTPVGIVENSTTTALFLKRTMPK